MPKPFCVILAGGLARRMGGGDKGLHRLGGETILARIIRLMRPQVSGFVINANGDAARFAEFGLPVASDSVPDFAGPLAGVLAGLEYARRQASAAQDVLSVPSDAPFLPGDLVTRLIAARAAAHADLACASSGGQAHPVIGLWPLRLYENLRAAVADEGIRKVDIWTARHKLAEAEFASDPVDPFFNANRPEDIAEAERLLARMPA